MHNPLPTALVTLLLLASPALAQNDVCLDANGNVDQAATVGWQNFQAGASADAMQQLVGTWYTEIPSPQTGQMAYRYQTLEPNGLFTMQTRVCDSTGACSDYPGHGFWAAQGGQGGAFTTMTITSETQVTNFCGITQVMLQGNMMQSAQGQVWQRVQ
ncbi:hypothetical protein [Devosia sp. SL43]|uniref:hypothetical protein n=1 Tax=Devosia sp. SL43 TaxID=2806348 RepID=UPI001F36A7D3|nr:hypothetical protein [Devosia sp. SL43]UJW85034.1 hypothetical protein IM737_16730 [Devosia sp. SL43]